MPLPHNALVLVADGRKMLFFRNHGDENQIDLRTESHDARRYQRRDREIKTDAPGLTKQSFGYGRSTYGQGCLLARRLAEAGVKFTTVYFSNNTSIRSRAS